MSRPRKQRACDCPKRSGRQGFYVPSAGCENAVETIELYCDELEALHLCDGEGLSQAAAGGCMGVSRGTVQRILSSARTKVAKALTNGYPIYFTSRLNCN